MDVNRPRPADLMPVISATLAGLMDTSRPRPVPPSGDYCYAVAREEHARHEKAEDVARRRLN